MVLKLAERLNVPLRERNVLLVAAGFAPAFPQRSLEDPALESARAAIDLVLRAHEPNPALAYDRHWNTRPQQPHGVAAVDRRSAAAADTARQYFPARPSSRSAGRAHREYRGMGRASPGAPAPSMRDHRRPRAYQALHRAEDLSDPCAIGAIAARQRRHSARAAPATTAPASCRRR